MEAALYRYVCLQRANGVAISVKDTQKWSREWMKKHHPGKNWNASSHWSQRFRDRWNLVMRVKTKVGQRLSAECAKDCESFWKFVRINRARHNIDLARIINADQTPFFVEMPAERTIEHRGARSVPIRTAGYEETRLTVMLACTASGEKLRPWDNGWMDESAVQTWLTKEVLPHLNPQRGQNARRAMLVLDSYRGHITQAMLQAYRTHSITLAVIPTGCTSQIQPLDVSTKAAVRARYAKWFMREGIHLKTKAGNLRRPPHPVVLQWIAEAWDQVPKKVIIEAFRHCGISSKLDGTENHLVMSHLRARSTTDVSEDMCLGGTTGDNTRLLGQAPEEEDDEMQAEGVREVAVASGLDVLYQETPNYRGAVAEAGRMIEPRETARHAWRVQDLGVREPVFSAVLSPPTQPCPLTPPWPFSRAALILRVGSFTAQGGAFQACGSLFLSSSLNLAATSDYCTAVGSCWHRTASAGPLLLLPHSCVCLLTAAAASALPVLHCFRAAVGGSGGGGGGSGDMHLHAVRVWGWRVCEPSPPPPPPPSPTAAAAAEGGGCVGAEGVVLGGCRGSEAKGAAGGVNGSFGTKGEVEGGWPP
ncbi:unnamed protein product [Closterium sp. NIES-54]